MPNDTDLDRMLNEALHSYVASEPGTHMEGRILATAWNEARETRLARRQRWSWWSVAMAACLLLVCLAVYVSHSRRRTVQFAQMPRQSRPTSLAPAEGNRQAAPDSGVPSKAVRVRSHLPAVIAGRAEVSEKLPKLDVFPTPQPLTAEERGLLTLVAQVPNDQKQALAKPVPAATKPLEVEPLRIAVIEIKPLPPLVEGEQN
jgi:hypothetical protein